MTTGAASASGSGSPGLRADGPSAVGAGSGAASVPPASPPPPPSPPTSAPKRRGSWFATFWTFLFALVALAAAAISVGAPSYRAEVRQLLQHYAPELSERVVNMVTGYDSDRLEVTYDGLDARIDRLTKALERVVSTEGLTQEAARELLLRDEMSAKLDDVDARLQALSGVTGEVTETLPAQQAAIEALKAEMTAEIATLNGELAAASETLVGSIDALRAELVAAQDALKSDLVATQDVMASLGQRSDVLEAGMTEVVEGQAELAGRTEAIEGRVATLTDDFRTLLDINERTAELVSVFESKNMPVLALLQLEGAVAGSTPFPQELAFARMNLDDAAVSSEAFGMLTTFSTTGVSSISELRRDLRLIADQSNSIAGRGSNWGSQLGEWFSMLIGAVASPQSALSGGIKAAAETIDDALGRGDLELAVAEASVMITDSRSGALNDWLVGLRDRYQLSQSMKMLQATVYGRAATDQGAGKKPE
jgi:cell division protein FtsB